MERFDSISLDSSRPFLGNMYFFIQITGVKRCRIERYNYRKLIDDIDLKTLEEEV
jgi:hypothetical protein